MNSKHFAFMEPGGVSDSISPFEESRMNGV